MTDVLQALRDVSLTAEERLKVAAAIARHGNPEDKVTLLAKWACDEICNAYSKKNRSPPSVKVCSQLWLFLATTVESTQLMRQQHQRHSQSHWEAKRESQCGALLSIHLVQAMCDVLKSGNAECVNPVLRCLLHLLRCQPLPSVLYRFEVVVSMLLSVLMLAGMATDRGQDEPKSKSRGGEGWEVEGEGGEEYVEMIDGGDPLLESTLCLVLDHYTYLQGTQGNQKKVFSTVCSQLLPLVINLRQSPLANGGVLGTKLDALLYSLFSKDHLAEYTSVLSQHFAVSSEKQSTISYTKQLFWCLQELLDSQDSHTCQATLCVLPSIFEGFLQCNSELKKLSKRAEFQFFLKLLCLLGYHVNQTTKRKNKHKKARVELYREGVGDDKGEEEDIEEEGKVGEGEGEERGSEEEEEEAEEGEVEEEGEEGDVEEEVVSDGVEVVDGVKMDQGVSEDEREGEELVGAGETDTEKEEEEGKERDVGLNWEVMVARVVEGGEEELSENEERDNRRFSNSVLKVLISCLHLLRVHTVYQVAQDQSSGNSQFECLSSLCIEVVKNTHSHNLTAVAQCAEEALQLNHKLVEPLLPGLLLLATSNSDLRAQMDSFVQKSIIIYSKLHQLSVLVGKLFSALEIMAVSSSLPTAVSPVFSKSSEDCFCKRTQDLPPGQSIALLEQLTHSLQTIFIARIPPSCITGAEDEVQNPLPRKKRKRSRMKNEKTLATFSSNMTTSSCFSVALLHGVDVLSLVLLNTPVSLWASEGMHRERASAALLGVKRDVCAPLMESAMAVPALSTAALCLTHNLQSLLFCIRDTTPSTAVVASDSSADTASTHSLLVSNEVQLVWSDERNMPIPGVWVGKDEGEGERKVFSASSSYFLKAMSVQQLRFEKLSSENTTHFLDFVYEEDVTSPDLDSTWSGQPLDINDGNFPTAVWDLALTNLPRFYHECLPTHLQNVASFLYSALLRGVSASRSGDEESVREEKRQRTGWEVAWVFLHSENFQDMRRLQELLLVVCFERAALLLPKSLQELKTSLLSCSGQLLDSSEHLRMAIEQGLLLLDRAKNGDIKSTKKRKSVLKTAQHLSICLKVMKVIPMAFVFPELLQRCVLTLTISHIAVVRSLEVSCTSRGEVTHNQLSELQLVLAWVLLSLVHRDRVGRKKTPRLSPLPFSQLLTWVYTAAKHCTDLVEDKDLQFRASSLLLLEAALESALKTGSYPTCYVQLVVDDVSTIATSTEETCSDALPLSMFQLTVTKICKSYCALKPGQRDGSFLHEPLGQLLREAMKPLSHLRKKAPERVQVYPQLASGFCLLLRTNPPSDAAGLSRSLKVARFLSDSLCSEEALNTAITSPSILFTVIDTLSLAISLTEDTKSDEHVTTVAESWSKLVSLLKAFLDQDIDKNGGYLVELCHGRLEGRYISHRGTTPQTAVPSTPQRVAPSTPERVALSTPERVVPYLSEALTLLLASADREQATSMFQLIHGESSESASAALAVCHCWRVILSAKLQPESQREIRKWHRKILVQCESLAIQHREVSPVVIMSLNITTRLVALPARVGLDSRLVLVSLHQTAILENLPVTSSQRCLHVLQSVGQLLFTVLKNHSSVAASCPGPVVTAVNKLVRVVLEQCAKTEECVENGAANIISRIFDHFAGQQEFSRYFSCIMSSYAAVSGQNLPAKTVKTSLLPGVYSLLRQCSDEDTAFIQASLDPTARIHFQSLLEDFRRQKRFL